MKKKLKLSVSFPRQVSSELKWFHGIRKKKIHLLNEHILKLSLLLWSLGTDWSSEVSRLFLRQTSYEKHARRADMNHEGTEIPKALGQRDCLQLLEHSWRHLAAALARWDSGRNLSLSVCSRLWACFAGCCWGHPGAPKCPWIPVLKCQASIYLPDGLTPFSVFTINIFTFGEGTRWFWTAVL